MSAGQSRITRAFARARAEKRKALVIYLTVGDPDAATSLRLISAAARAGADVIELGVPWSDPSADGPAIAAAMKRAREKGGGMTASLEICRATRQAHPDVGLVLFGYANPIFVRGPERFATEAKAAGADGVLCVDWPPDEDRDLPFALKAQGLDFIPLVAPTSTAARIEAASTVASGFLYYVSFTGITGAKLSDLEGPRAHLTEIRRITGDRLPVVVGFGISTPDDARAVAGFADGVVVGSAAIRVIEKAVAEKQDPEAALSAFVKSLRAAL